MRNIQAVWIGCLIVWASLAVAENQRHLKDFATTISLSALDLSRMSSGWKRPQRGLSVDGNPLSLGGKVYADGIGTHAPSQLHIDLQSGAAFFSALVGVDDECRGKGSVTFEVWIDDQLATRTPVLTSGSPPYPLSADLSGAHRMRLVASTADEFKDFDHADWVNGVITLVPTSCDQPCFRCPQVIDPVLPPDPEIAHSGDSEFPTIHGPRITGGTPGKPFLFRIPATGARPLRFTAVGLPPGLMLHGTRGMLEGTLETTGTTTATLTVKNPLGSCSRELIIVSGHRKLALTPPLGWSSWNVWGHTVDDAKVRAAADALVQTGLADHGFTYVNIDDGWEGKRSPDGILRPNKKFPDMKGLADHLHQSGLKLGIYSSPGPRTCAGYAGSYQHEEQDARTWASWGIDYLKYDWCSYGDLPEVTTDLDDAKKPYKLMRTALDRCDRDVVYSLCQYGIGGVWTWGADPEVGGNLWRTSNDITDDWSSVATNGFALHDLAKYAGPGHWNDPDMLVVGYLGWGSSPRPTDLTPHEQVSHLTLWSMLAAPLMLGCDLTKLDDFTLSLLKNDGMLDIHQDMLGVAGRRIARVEQIEVWSRPLWDGSQAVGLFNRGSDSVETTLTLSMLNIDAPVQVTDVWRNRELGAVEEGLSVKLATHGALLLKVRPWQQIHREGRP